MVTNSTKHSRLLMSGFLPVTTQRIEGLAVQYNKRNWGGGVWGGLSLWFVSVLSNCHTETETQLVNWLFSPTLYGLATVLAMLRHFWTGSTLLPFHSLVSLVIDVPQGPKPSRKQKLITVALNSLTWNISFIILRNVGWDSGLTLVVLQLQSSGPPPQDCNCNVIVF